MFLTHRFFVILLLVTIALAIPATAANIPLDISVLNGVNSMQSDGVGGVCYTAWTVSGGWEGFRVKENQILKVDITVDQQRPELGCVGDMVFSLQQLTNLGTRSFQCPRTGRWRDIHFGQPVSIFSQGLFFAQEETANNEYVMASFNGLDTPPTPLAETGKFAGFSQACATMDGVYGMSMIGELTQVFSLKGHITPISAGQVASRSLFGQEQSYLSCTSNNAVHVYRDQNGIIWVNDLVSGALTTYNNVGGYLSSAAVGIDGTVFVAVTPPALWTSVYALMKDGNLFRVRTLSFSANVALVTSGDRLYVGVLQQPYHQE